VKKIIPDNVQNLIDELSRLPGIGPKLAARLVFYLISKPETDIERLSGAIARIKENLRRCPQCYNITEGSEQCVICQDPTRSKNLICVVEQPLDVVAIEKTGIFSGIYHVLGGNISPIEGIGPENLNIKPLIDRLKKSKEEAEVIIATNPSLEGEATAMYLAKELAKLKSIKVTRIARGIPAGGDLEYADEITLSKALEGRIKY